MITMLSIYVPLIFTLHASHELYNFNNPRIDPRGTYVLLQWETDDFYADVNNIHRPYLKAKADNYFKRKARIKYWQRKQLGRE
jgi:microcystin degradation protein MlrC